MNKNMMMVFAVITAFSICAEAKSYAEYADGETIVHFPLDNDFLSVSNAECQVSPIVTNNAAGIVFTTETAGTNVISGCPIRANAGAVVLDKSHVIINLSDYGIDHDATDLTVEFMIKGYADRVPADWKTPITMATLASAPQTSTKLYNNEPNVMIVQTSGRAAGATAYLRATSVMEGVNRSDTINLSNRAPVVPGIDIPRVFDGEWHCMSVSFAGLRDANNVVTGSHFTAYLDYRHKFWDVVTANIWRALPDVNKQVYLALGDPAAVSDDSSQNLKVAFDELRIVKGAIGWNQRLRVSNATGAEKEEIMRLSFEGDTECSAHPLESPAPVAASTLSYGGGVKQQYVLPGKNADRDSAKKNIMCANAGKNSRVELKLPNWELAEEYLDSATIEFFIRCSTDVTAWEMPVRIQDTGKSGFYPFLVQVNKSGCFYLRVDSDYVDGGLTRVAETVNANTPFTANDGKWHHIAATFVPNGDGTTTVAFYADYALLSEVRTKTAEWRGFNETTRLYVGDKGNTATWQIDELRVSKGALVADDFLRQKGLGGLLMVVR